MSDTPDLPAALRRFDVHLDLRGCSAKTRRHYRYELVCWWVDWVFASDLELAEIRPRDIEEYLGALPANGSKRGGALRALRAFFRWAAAEGETDADPTSHLPMPRPKIGPAPDLPDRDIRRLLRAAFHHEPRRGWAIMLCYVTGARVGSLVAVRPCDVHLGPDARLDLLEAKGGRPYSVPLERAGVIAARHLQDSRIMNLESRFVSPNAHDRLIGVGAERFRQWVHAAEQEAGLGRVWPHLLRHAFLTRVAHTDGVSPEEVRRLANWADLSQWPRYVAGSDPIARKAVAAVMGGRAPTPGSASV